jgi:DNA-binding response OmpR family regulator
MPQMSGYELARTWRQHEDAIGTSHRLPILAMTANTLSSETARAHDAGMSDVLSKPLQLLALSEKLQQWLPEQTPTPIVDHKARSRVARHDTAHAELQHLFTTVSQSDLLDLQACLKRQDAPAALQVLHRLLGALPLFDDGDLLERGRRLFDDAQVQVEPQVLADLATFAQQLDQLLSKLDRQQS